MKQITVSSGADVKIGDAGFLEAMTLKNAVLRGLANYVGGLEAIFSGAAADMDVSELLKVVMQLDSDPAFNAAVMPCLGRCTYNGNSISAATFEIPAARADYYDIVIACLQVNLTPFFKPLIARLLAFRGAQKKESDQK